MRKLFRVERRHVKAGQVLSTSCCPIALRLREDDDKARISYAGIVYRGRLINLPKRIHDKMEKFDRTGKMSPFNFYLEVPK